MAYEYEKFVLSLLTSLAIKKENKGYYVISDEVEDVYRKAEAWDNYVSEVRERVKITVNTEDDIEKETQEIIDYYMEGK